MYQSETRHLLLYKLGFFQESSRGSSKTLFNSSVFDLILRRLGRNRNITREVINVLYIYICLILIYLYI